MSAPDQTQPLDYAATSRRAAWGELPQPVQDATARLAGAPVVAADPPVTSGFTGGAAMVITLADGRRAFLKAGYGHNPHLINAYHREALVLGELPAGVPAPQLLGATHLPAGVAGEFGWQLVLVEAIMGTMPMPWTTRRLDAVHSGCLAMAAALSTADGGWPGPQSRLGELPTLVDDFARDGEITGAFPAIAAGSLPVAPGQPDWLPDRLDDLQQLVRHAETALAGEVANHHDLRADNILIESDGTDCAQAVFVDWNFLTRGPAWTDFVGLLPIARRDGVDVDPFVTASPLTADVPDDDIDAWLAIIAAYMLVNAPKPLWPGGTPAIRVHQARYARAFLDWLAHRRSW